MTNERVSDNQTLTYDLGNEIEHQPRERHLEVITFSARHLEVTHIPRAMETKLHVNVVKVFIQYKILDRNYNMFSY